MQRIPATFLLFAALLTAQGPAFETASIKPTPPRGDPAVEWRIGPMPGGGLAAEELSLKSIIQWAYDVHGYQVSGNVVGRFHALEHHGDSADGGVSAHANSILTNGTTTQFLTALPGNNLNQPVTDETGLKGSYSSELKWASDQPASAEPGAPPAETGPSIFAAIE